MVWFALAWIASATTPSNPELMPADLAEKPMDEQGAAGPVVDPLLGRPFEPTRPGQTSPADPYWKYEVNYHKGAYDVCAQEGAAEWEQTKDPHVAFHLARCQFNVGEERASSMSKGDRVAFYTDMIAMLNEARAAAPKDLHLRFAHGVAEARLGTARGVLASLKLATSIEESWKTVAESDFVYSSIDEEELLPCDAMYSLGVFYRLVPDSGLVKMLAGTKGDLELSRTYLQRANDCRPNTIRYLKELGATELCQGKKTKDEALTQSGLQHLTDLLALPARFGVEKIDQQHGMMMQVNPKMACGYSRDGQQELDERRLQKK